LKRTSRAESRNNSCVLGQSKNSESQSVSKMGSKEGDTLFQRWELYSLSWLPVDPAYTGGEALFLADDADPGFTQDLHSRRTEREEDAWKSARDSKDALRIFV
jgi:hypothetical protein